MNKKELGASLRRGVVAGTIAGSLAGWASFSARAAVAPYPVDDTLTPAAAPALPALPSPPALAPLPNVRAVQAPALVQLPPVRVGGPAPITKTRSS